MYLHSACNYWVLGVVYYYARLKVTTVRGTMVRPKITSLSKKTFFHYKVKDDS